MKLPPLLPTTKLFGSAMHLILREFSSEVVGATIIDAGYIDSEPGDTIGQERKQVWPVLRLKKKDGTILELMVQADDEGNAPGSLVLTTTKTGHPLMLCQTHKI